MIAILSTCVKNSRIKAHTPDIHSCHVVLFLDCENNYSFKYLTAANGNISKKLWPCSVNFYFSNMNSIDTGRKKTANTLATTCEAGMDINVRHPQPRVPA
jgi:hypothetical protein